MGNLCSKISTWELRSIYMYHLLSFFHVTQQSWLNFKVARPQDQEFCFFLNKNVFRSLFTTVKHTQYASLKYILRKILYELGEQAMPRLLAIFFQVSVHLHACHPYQKKTLKGFLHANMLCRTNNDQYLLFPFTVKCTLHCTQLFEVVLKSRDQCLLIMTVFVIYRID